jgi:hypothetical protein
MTWNQFLALGSWQVAWRVLANLDPQDQQQFAQINRLSYVLYKAYEDHLVAVFMNTYMNIDMME